MIKADAKLSITRIPVESLQIKGVYEEPLSVDRVMFYYHKLIDNPGMYLGPPPYVVPSDTHHNSLSILDGRHKFLASLLAGKPDVLCIVEEPA